MQHRSIVTLFLLTVVTLGLYAIYWMVKTKDELNQRGAAIPTAWLALVPGVNLWWTWKYCAGVEQVTGGKTSQAMAFVMLVLLGVIGMAIVQDAFNKAASPGTLAPARAV